ncbi:MAG: V-type ATP synthase subunit F [Peptoniphilaceae bacterium]|nr:V-type ATP synthase subunit F [Peptoniphilaceae bacterium]MDD7383812.1 V-type ATP synthase subunit F [Peptoniphilaceae bacterium]MDY3737790.1 V-type ATP synthase subunit F [Peptoniphilaceae bacterium]
MKAKILSQDRDLVLGLRLGGITGKLVNNYKEANKYFDIFLKEEDLGVLILGDSIYKKLKYKVDEERKKRSKPLIVVLEEK